MGSKSVGPTNVQIGAGTIEIYFQGVDKQNKGKVTVRRFDLVGLGDGRGC